MAILKTIFAGPDKPKIPKLQTAPAPNPKDAISTEPLQDLSPSGQSGKRRSIATSPRGVLEMGRTTKKNLKVRLGG